MRDLSATRFFATGQTERAAIDEQVRRELLLMFADDKEAWKAVLDLVHEDDAAATDQIESLRVGVAVGRNDGHC